MSLWTLVLRGLRHYRRTNAGVVAGSAIATAVLVGALVVGDSVRASLRGQAELRIGAVDAVLASNDRFFRAELAAELAQDGTRTAPAIQVPGVASTSDSARRVHDVQVYGVDGRFAFYDNVNVLGYFSKTQTPGRRGRDTSYLGDFAYTGDRYGLELSHLVVEDNFIPEVGFVRRDNIARTTGSARFSPRPRSVDWIRRFVFEGSLDYVEAADTGLVETRLGEVGFETELENSDRVSVSVADTYEFLTQPFEIATGVVIPVGGHRFSNATMSYSFGQQRPVSGSIAIQRGQFWTGDATRLTIGRGRIEWT